MMGGGCLAAVKESIFSGLQQGTRRREGLRGQRDGLDGSNTESNMQ